MRHPCIFSFLYSLAILFTPVQALAQDKTPESAKTKSEQILFGFVPDLNRLEMIKQDELKQLYPGKTVKGIYTSNRHDDYRYVESFTAVGRTSYKEDRFSSTGDWYVKGDNLCFEYDEKPDSEHCFYEFYYGDCIIAYSSDRRILGEKPLLPGRWVSVGKIAEAGFDWANITSEEAGVFNCYSLIS